MKYKELKCIFVTSPVRSLVTCPDFNFSGCQVKSLEISNRTTPEFVFTADKSKNEDRRSEKYH